MCRSITEPVLGCLPCLCWSQADTVIVSINITRLCSQTLMCESVWQCRPGPFSVLGKQDVPNGPTLDPSCLVFLPFLHMNASASSLGTHVQEHTLRDRWERITEKNISQEADLFHEAPRLLDRHVYVILLSNGFLPLPLRKETCTMGRHAMTVESGERQSKLLAHCGREQSSFLPQFPEV